VKILLILMSKFFFLYYLVLLFVKDFIYIIKYQFWISNSCVVWVLDAQNNKKEKDQKKKREPNLCFVEGVDSKGPIQASPIGSRSTKPVGQHEQMK
jgi:hypothetical protein